MLEAFEAPSCECMTGNLRKKSVDPGGPEGVGKISRPMAMLLATTVSPVIILAWTAMILFFQDFTSIGTIVLGAVAFFLPTFFFVYFFRIKQNLMARAFAWMLLGESIGMLVANMFAIFAHYGVLMDITPHGQSMLRLVVFNSAILSSIHMVKSVIFLQVVKPVPVKD